MSATVIAPLDDLVPGTVKRFEIEGRLVAVVRIDDSVYAIGDTCSHGNVSLSEGEVLCDDLELECWKHGSTFSLITGEPLMLPAIKPVPVYSASVVDGNIVIDVERSTPVSTPAPEGAES